MGDHVRVARGGTYVYHQDGAIMQEGGVELPYITLSITFCHMHVAI